MAQGIRNVVQYTCKRCKRAYWSTDEKRGWCDECRNAQKRIRMKRKRSNSEIAGQLRLDLE